MPGPPSRLTPELQERICKLIRVGVTNKVAGEAVGIAQDTFYRWQQTNSEFAEALQQARAEASANLVARISQAAQKGSWKAACWLLERQWPEEWGRGGDSGPRGADEDLAAELDRLAAKKQRRRDRAV